MKLETRVFELCNGKYANLSQLARAMGISLSEVYRVKQGQRHIHEKFIIGAVKAFPRYKLDDLFYVSEGSENVVGTTNEAGMDSRRDEVVKLGKAGLSYAEIGRRFGISRERARQIAKGRPTPQKPDLRPEAMLAISDVARLLNVHINTVRRWNNRGMLKAYHIGTRGDRRFRREDVDRFLREGENE